MSFFGKSADWTKNYLKSSNFEELCHPKYRHISWYKRSVQLPISEFFCQGDLSRSYAHKCQKGLFFYYFLVELCTKKKLNQVNFSKVKMYPQIQSAKNLNLLILGG